MISLKSSREIALMREAGKVVAQALDLARQMVRPGVKTIEIDRAVEDFFAQQGVVPLFKGVPGKVPFPAVICISINEQVVHGIPGDRVIEAGDIVSIDTGCKLNGWCGDSATTIPVEPIGPDVRRLLDVAEESLNIAIREVGQQRRWSQVARIMEEYVKKEGFSLVEKFVGHGIGREMHEEPQVPNFVGPDLLKNDFWLEEGLTLAIEPMVNMGTKQVRLLKDHWTVVTRDNKPSAHFEHAVAITADGPLVLTALDGAAQPARSS